MKNKKPGNFALLLTGAVTSGKSRLVYSIDDLLFLKFKKSIHFINEESVGNFYRIVDNIDPFKYPVAAFEHCWIQQKWYLFDGVYNNWKIIMLKLNKDLLQQNYHKRIEIGSSGDFININPIQQQDIILNHLDEISKKGFSENISVFEINSLDDYKDPAQLAFSLISEYLN